MFASLGTVINDRPGFYRTLIEALRDEDVDLLISCGKAFDPTCLGDLPANVRVEHYVDQMEVLSRASLFVTHCGMNSASEGMWMAVPELLFPLTGEQRAVARRVAEVGAGVLLDENDAKDALKLKAAVLCALVDEEHFRRGCPHEGRPSFMRRSFRCSRLHRAVFPETLNPRARIINCKVRHPNHPLHQEEVSSVMILEKLPQPHSEKARACGSVDELLVLAKENKIPLPDEALTAIAGGQDGGTVN